MAVSRTKSAPATRDDRVSAILATGRGYRRPLTAQWHGFVAFWDKVTKTRARLVGVAQLRGRLGAPDWHCDDDVLVAGWPRACGSRQRERATQGLGNASERHGRQRGQILRTELSRDLQRALLHLQLQAATSMMASSCSHGLRQRRTVSLPPRLTVRTSACACRRSAAGRRYRVAAA